MRVLPRLCLITDRRPSGSRSLVDVVGEAIAGGLRFLQYREKELGRRATFEEAQALRDVTAAQGILFVINDDVDLALAVGADGVHLGHDDLPLGVARSLLGPNRLIGISTHTVEEALEAQAGGADYIGLGPIFETGTKTIERRPLGFEEITAVQRRVAVPIFAIGGITLERASGARQAGAYGVAVISAILANPDVRRATRDFIRVLASPGDPG